MTKVVEPARLPYQIEVYDRAVRDTEYASREAHSTARTLEDLHEVSTELLAEVKRLRALLVEHGIEDA